MSKTGSNLGKPLSGVFTITPSITTSVSNSVATDINSGSTSFSNISITGGTINGVTIGSNNPVVLNTTTIQAGNAQGNGYSVCFYGNIIGDSACWKPTIGQWDIQGDLAVRDISDFGNLRISGGILSSTNNNGNITLTPNGNGLVQINSGINQSTLNNNTVFNTVNGRFTSTSGLDTTLSTTNGDIKLITGTNIPNYTISAIGTGTIGSGVTITTTSNHNLLAGEMITISGSNSNPNIDGNYSINTVLSSTSFTITPPVNVTTLGTSGIVSAQKNIYLTASDNIFIPQNVPLIFGTGSSNGSPSLVSNGSTTTLTSPDIVFNGNFTVTGTTSTTNSSVVTIQDPVFNLGGTAVYTVADIMDRGISFKYYNNVGSPGNPVGDKIGYFGRNTATGCFTYIPNATQVNNVYTGLPGCADFGALSADTLLLRSGGTANITTLNVCTINCTSGAFNFNATTSLLINSPSTTVSGNAIFNGTITATNGLTTLSSLAVNGTATIGTLNTCNISCPTGTLNIGSGTSISGTLNVCNISCTGVFTLSGTTRVDVVSPATSFSGTVTATNGLTTLSSLQVNGTANIGTLNTCNISCLTGTLNIGSNTSISGTLNVCTISCATGTLNLSGLTSVTIGGTLNTCNITCPAGNLQVNSSTSVTVTSPSTVLSGNLSTTNGNITTTNGDISTTTGNVSGVNGNFTNLSATTQATVGTLNTCNITCTAGSLQLTSTNTTVSGVLNVCNITCPAGNLQVNSATSVTVTSPSTILSGNLSSTNGNISLTTGNISTTSGNISTSTGNVSGINGNFTNLSATTQATVATLNTCNITCAAGVLTLSSTNTNVSGILNVCNITCPAGNLQVNSATTFTVNSLNTNLSSTGTTTVNNLAVNGTVTGISLVQVQRIEHIDAICGNVVSPTANFNITFVNTSTVIYNITNIPSGSYTSSPLTVTCINSLVAGQQVTITGTSVINGDYTIVSRTATQFVITFTGSISGINITGSVFVNNSTGVLAAPSVDGFEKKIVCSFLAPGTKYSLLCPAGRLIDPITGTTGQKYIDFEYVGQSVYLIYSGVRGYYIAITSNACVHT